MVSAAVATVTWSCTDPPAPLAVSVYTPAATPPRSTVEALNPFGPLHEVEVVLVTVTSIAPVAVLQLAAVVETSTAVGGGAMIVPTWVPPLAMREAKPRFAGIVVWPLAFEPQATTEPFERSATEWALPAATAVTPERPAGTASVPPVPVFWPQVATVPSARAAIEWNCPPAMAATFARPAGGTLWP